MRYKRSAGSTVFDVLNYFFMILLSIAMLYPFLHVLSLSLSDPKLITRGRVSWYPQGVNVEGYKIILGSSQLWTGYRNTIIYAGLGTLLTLVFTSLMAYPLSIRDFVGRKFVTIFLTITMFFSGGMIPTYLLIKKLKLINTIWVMVLPGCISAYNVIVFRSFFQGISGELRESAYLDGANDIVILFKIILPLSKALLATFGLFTIVGHWNAWFPALMYLNKDSMYPVQMVLRRILFVSSASETSDLAAMRIAQKQVHSKNIQMATIIVTIIPILCIYPFIQKHFAKGVLVGSLKG